MLIRASHNFFPVLLGLSIFVTPVVGAMISSERMVSWYVVSVLAVRVESGLNRFPERRKPVAALTCSNLGMGTPRSFMLNSLILYSLYSIDRNRA